MNYQKNNLETNTITRDLICISKKTNNIYESIRIIGARSNQISINLKKQLEKKIQEFSSYTDFPTEIHENKERIEISRFFEYRPKPTLIAIQEFIDDKIHFHYTSK